MSNLMIFSGYKAAHGAPSSRRSKTMKRGKAQRKLAKAAKSCSRKGKKGKAFTACVRGYFRKH